MKLHMLEPATGLHRWVGRLGRLFLTLSLLAAVLWPVVTAPPQPAVAASPIPINLIVVEYIPAAVPDGTTTSGSYPTTGTYGTIELAEFTFIVNDDNTGDASSPNVLDHPGRRPMPSYSPIVFAGDQTTPAFSEEANFLSTNPRGRYLISVRAPGYKLWGAHIDLYDDPLIPGTDTTPDFDPSTPELDVRIGLIADPLPLSNLRVHVFHDRMPVNSAPAPGVDAEPGLAGFHVEVEDPVGDVTVDWFGNPICTQYYPPGGPGTVGAHPFEPGLGVDAEGNPVPIAHTGGKCTTYGPWAAFGPNDLNADGIQQGDEPNAGDVIIRYLPYGQYNVFVIPPEPESVDSTVPNTSRRWIQTSTFEGTLAIEHARIEEGSDGWGATYEAAREPLILPTAFWFGFIQECTFGDTADTCPTNDIIPGNAGSITGQIVTWTGWPPFEEVVFNEPVYRPVIALNSTGGGDQQVYTGRGDENGNFTITGVPPGLYQLAIFDDPLDYIITYRTVNVGPGEAVDMGDIGIFRWFGWVSGYVFLDTGILEDGTDLGPNYAGNAIRDCADMVAKTNCEIGIPAVDLDIRFRDGSIKSATFTDIAGYYEYPEELGPLFKFDIAEVGFGRFQRTGHSWHSDLLNNPNGDHDNDSVPNRLDPDLAVPAVVNPDTGGGLLLNTLTLEGKRSRIDWGKRPYDTTDPTEHGGITGVVFFATTRNEFDARLAAAEDYEPGLPGVTMRLWGLGPNGVPNNPGDPDFDDVLLNELQTDAWEQPTGCDVTNRDGLVLGASTATQQDLLYGFTYTFHDILNPTNGDPQCIEYPLLSNEVQPGAFDGGYAFETYCTLGVLPGGGCLLDLETPLAAGTYVVEAVPLPYYQILKEEDQNTDEGDDLQPIPLFPPPACVGPLHLVNDPRNPFDGELMPLCNKRMVRLQRGQNPAADFFMFTDIDIDPTTNTVADGSWSTIEAVPIPGRIWGLVADDFVRDTNPNSLWYGEERPVPDTPVGFRDYTGRALITINTDENGYYEALLPSSFQANCPIPSGICPGMYIVRVNDPGDIIPGIPPDSPNYVAANPNYKKNYLTEPAPFQVWPGKMTKADTPIDPTGWWSCATIDNPTLDPVDPMFGVPVDVEFYNISIPYGPPGTQVVVNGNNFDRPTGTPPVVTLDGVPIPLVAWTNNVLTATVAGVDPGPRQLLVTNGEGTASFTGITFHVIGGAYTPPIVPVDPPTSPGTPVIQAAIDDPSTSNGSLIIVRPGTYHESPILHRGVRVQGYGPGGLAGLVNTIDPISGIEDPRVHIRGSVIEGRFFQSYRAAWIASRNGIDTTYIGDPTAPVGAAVTVVGPLEGGSALLDGFWITGGRAEAGGGGIHVDREGTNLQISNNILENNGGVRGGGISLGRLVSTADRNNDNVRISYNRLINNTTVSSGGGIAIFDGAGNYRINNNDICGNYSGEYGGGIAHIGLSPNGQIDRNVIRLNDAFDEGGGILVGGDPFSNAGLGAGSGPVDIGANLVLGNFSQDDGGGIRLLRALDDRIQIVNNMIAHNMAADHGGGVSLDDSSNVEVVNNTIAANYSTSTNLAEALTALDSPFGPLARTLPRGAGLTSEPHSSLFQATLPTGAPTFSNPAMFNNLFWGNNAYFWDPNVIPVTEIPGVEGFVRIPLQAFGQWDLEVTPGPGTGCFNQGPTSSIFTGVAADFTLPTSLNTPYGPDANGCDPGLRAAPGNQFEVDPLFLRPRNFSEFNAAASVLNQNFISVEFWRIEGGEGTLGSADYHVLPGSAAIDAGSNQGPDPINGPILAPCRDFDDDGRPFNGIWDIGADEQPGLPVSPLCNGTTILLYFSTVGNVPPPGLINGDNADIYTWDGAFFGRVFDGSAAGLPGNADIDALMVVDSDTFYMSFSANGGTTVPTLGVVQDEDIVLYDAGTWSMFFDGSDVGLDGGDAEDVDAFDILPDGSVVISTRGNPVVSGPALTPTPADEDLLRCVGTFGPTTTCTWSLYFEGSDILLTMGSEDVDGAAVQVIGATVNIYLSTLGGFSVTGGFVGGGEDVWLCSSAITGSATACTGGFSTFYDGSGLAANDLDAFDLP